MNRVGVVYAIENAVNGRAYVGSTVRPKKRWWTHQNALRRGRHCNSHLQNAWNKYSEDVFEFVVLEEDVPGGCLVEREQYWLDRYRMTGDVYNCATVIGAPMKGRKHSAKTRQRMSEVHKGKKHSLEARQNMSRAQQARPYSPRSPLGTETRRKIGAANAGTYPAFRHYETGEIIPAGDNLSKLCRGRGLSVSNMWCVARGEQRFHRGWVLLDSHWETSQWASKMGRYPAFRHRVTGEIIPPGQNLSAMCRERGLNRRAMCSIARGKRYSHGGWMLLNVQWKGLGKPYPAFQHCVTGEIIPPGRNLRAMCQKRELDRSHMWRVAHGERRSHKGWELA